MSHLQKAATGAFAGRVGHKAGGFIAKKFFHPSSMKNQRKLWEAQEKKREYDLRQQELEERREEERRIEGTRRAMYEATGEEQAGEGRGEGGGLTLSSAVRDNLTEEEQRAIEETKKRKRMLRAEEGRLIAKKKRQMNKSRFPEDVLERGHEEVWGSEWSPKRGWGYACCGVRERGVVCDQEKREERKKLREVEEDGEKKEKIESQGVVEVVDV